MKSFTRACLIFSGITISIGLLLVIISGIAGGGLAFADMVRSGSFTINNSNDFSRINQKDFLTFTNEYKDVKELSIDLNYAELNIGLSDTDTFKVKAENVLRGFTCDNKNGKLTIKDNSRRYKVLGNNWHPVVYLYIPKQVNFEKVELGVGLGTINASNLQTDDLIIDIGAGSFDADLITAKTSSLKVGTGELEIDQFITDDTNINCGTGKIELTGKINKNAVVECGLGNINLSLENKESDFNYKVSSGIGSIQIGEQSIGGMATSKSIGNNAKQDMDIDCGVGSIEINFDESL